MDRLKKSAIAFGKLLNFEYLIMAGSKNKLIELILYFEKAHYMHLVGLHKLTDLQLKRHSKEKMYDMIINDRITLAYIQKSVFFNQIENRIDKISLLEQVLDNNETIVKYKKGFANGTLIDASFVIMYNQNGVMIHYFIDIDQNSGKYYGKSFFIRNDDKFCRGQQIYKILKKVKYDKCDDHEELLINKWI